MSIRGLSLKMVLGAVLALSLSITASFSINARGAPPPHTEQGRVSWVMTWEQFSAEAERKDASNYGRLFEKDGAEVLAGVFINQDGQAFTEGRLPPGLYFNIFPDDVVLGFEGTENMQTFWEGSLLYIGDFAEADPPIVLPPRSAHCRDGYSCCAGDGPPPFARCVRDSEWNRRPPPNCQYGGQGSDTCASGGSS